MEIDVTDFYYNGRHSAISGSVAELGHDAGTITWENANHAVQEFRLLDTPEKLESFRGWIAGFGAWDEAEIQAWSDTEANALFLQFVASDIRSKNELNGVGVGWEEYEALSEDGTVGGQLFNGDDGRIYFYVGS